MNFITIKQKNNFWKMQSNFLLYFLMLKCQK